MQPPMSYASLRAGLEVNSLLFDALDTLEIRKGRALDLGAGPLNDTRFLLEAGFSVDAVDRDPHSLSLAQSLHHPCLNFLHADMRDIRIAAGAYQLIVAIHVLPFLPRADLPRIASAISDGLSEDGILCCTFLGLDDSWSQNRQQMTFVSHSEVRGLFSRLRPIFLSERKYNGTDATDEQKHWHVLRCIFQKQGSPADK